MTTRPELTLTFAKQLESVLEEGADFGAGFDAGEAQDKRRRHVSTTITDDEFRIVEELVSSDRTWYKTYSDVIYDALRSCLPLFHTRMGDKNSVGARIIKRIHLLQDHVRVQRQHFEMVNLVKDMGDTAHRFVQLGDAKEAAKFIQAHLDILMADENETFRRRYAITALESEKLIQVIKQLGEPGQQIETRLKKAAKIKIKTRHGESDDT